MSTTRLDRIGQLAFVLMCVAITGAAVQQVITARTAGVIRKPAPIAKGTKLSLPQEVTARGTRPSLLLVLSSNCRYCTESMPFYSRLAGLPQVQSGNLRLSVVSLQEEPVMREYLSKHRLPVASVIGLAQSGFNVTGTPTMVLVGTDGVVRQSWGGWLNAEEEKSVLASIGNLVQ